MEFILVLLGLGFIASPFIAMAMASSAGHRVTDLLDEVERLKQTVRRLERSILAGRATQAAEPAKATEPVKPAERVKPTGQAPASDTANVEPIELAPPTPLSITPLPIGPTPEQRDRVRQYAESLRKIHAEAKAAEPAAKPVEPAAQEPDATPEPAASQPADVKPPMPATPKHRPVAAPPKPPISFEELLSTKVMVWIAAVAVALAGVFLVRYFVQRGLLTDQMKIGLATLLGVGLIAMGELARWRKLGTIAQGLVAAGIPVLYAAILGAVQLYHMIGVGPAFVLLAAVTGAAVVLSLRHGQMVALLGLIGGFLMPVLIGAHEKPAVQLFGYLFLLQVALIAITRHRRWWWLTTAALVAGLVWAAAWIMLPWFDPSQASWVGLFLLLSVAAFLAGCWEAEDDTIGELRVATLIGWIAVPAALVLSAMLVRSAGFTNLDWAQLGLMGAASLVLARLRRQYLALPWIGAGIVAMLLVIWGADGTSAGTIVESVGRTAGQLGGRYLMVTAALGAVFAGGAYACIWGSRSASVFARLSAVAGVGFMLIAYWYVRPDAVAGPWWLWAAMLAALYGGLAMPVHARRTDMPGGEAALAAMLVAASTLVSIAIWWLVGEQQMQRPWVTVAWAIQMPAVAFIGRRYRVNDLFAFAGLLGVLIAVRLLMNPNIAAYPIGDHPVFNWLLWGYGLPVIGFAVTAWVMRGVGERLMTRWCEAAASIVAFAMLTLMVRHGFHPGEQFEGPANLYELATYASVWGLAGVGVAFAAEFWRRPVLRYASAGLIAAMVAITFAGSLLVRNPAFDAFDVGSTPVFNGMLYIYLLPACIAVAAAWVMRRREGAIAAEWCGLLIAAAWLTLEVRHGYFPQWGGGSVRLYEMATYAVAWGATGLAIAFAAERWERPTLRFGAAGLITAMIVATLGGSLFVLNPAFHPFDVGPTPVLNGMLFVYLLPAAMAFAAARIMRRRANAVVAEWSGLLIAMAWLTLEVRHGFFPQWGAGEIGLFEAATYSAAWGGAAIALWFAAIRWRRPVLDPAANGMLAAAVIAAIVGPLLLLNPLVQPTAVGSVTLFNGLLYLYGLPAVVALVGARLIHRRHGDRPAVAMLGVCGLVMLFALVTLEVRHAFVGPILKGPAPTNAEGYAYSAAWIIFACTLLAAALLIRTPIKTPLRWSSLAVMLAAVAKVFLYDTRQLEDLWRVLSFLGLGASLFVVAWVYQRFVFRREEAAEESLKLQV